MGTSTNGILFYGIWIEESEDPPWHEAENADADFDRDAWMEKHGGGLVADDHCAASYRMPFIAVPRSVKTARRGYPERITAESMQKIEQQWQRKLESFCSAYNIKPSRIGWHLASYWGN